MRFMNREIIGLLVTTSLLDNILRRFSRKKPGENDGRNHLSNANEDHGILRENCPLLYTRAEVPTSGAEFINLFSQTRGRALTSRRRFGASEIRNVISIPSSQITGLPEIIARSCRREYAPRV